MHDDRHDSQSTRRSLALRLLHDIAALILTLITAFLSMTCDAKAYGGDNHSVPNIVLILADDLGYGDLGCYGQKIVPTPNLDRMASEGMRFTQAYAGNNCCAPSRCALLTGLHSGHATVRDNGGSLDEKDLTIAAVLHEAGYATAAFGKWHLGAIGSSGDPQAQGFDLFYGINPKSGGSETHFSTTLYRNGEAEVVEANRNGARGAFGDDLFVAEALRFIGEHRAGPFFVYLALRTPHKALEAPEEAMAKFRGKFEETPFGGDSQVGSCPAPRAARAAMIFHLDDLVSRVRSSLQELQLDSNTLVLFASDNGPASAGGSDPEFFASAGNLRGLKFSMHEGGIRIPMIAWWPGTVPAAATCDVPCAFWDLMPTFAEMAGAACPKTDGISLMPALKGDFAHQERHDLLYWERAGKQAARAGDWKAILTAGTSAIERFDLKADPGETEDLAQVNSEPDMRMQALMKEAHVDNPQYPLSGPRKAPRRKRPLKPGAAPAAGVKP
jgi:arylsulfatase A